MKDLKISFAASCRESNKKFQRDNVKDRNPEERRG